MARNQFIIENALNAKLSIEDLANWFASNNYAMVDFGDGSFEFASYYGGRPIYHRLTEHKGYKTYAKEAFGGSLLVFEINVKSHEIAIECYAPMQIFGFINRELTFKEKASWITKYRKDGYKSMIALKQFIHAALNQKELIN